MKYAVLAICVFLIACSNREVHGTNIRLTSDQLVEIAGMIKDDLSSLGAISGHKVSFGKIVIRLNGEEVDLTPIVGSINRGIVSAGGEWVSDDPAVDFIVRGSINMYELGVGRDFNNQYEIRIVISNANGIVAYSQSYNVINVGKIPRFK